MMNLTLFPDILACFTCMGAPGHQLNIAAGNAILFMVGIVAVVMAGIFAMIFNLVRRAKKYGDQHDAL